MVAGGECDHAAATRGVVELGERVVRAAELKRAHALQVLALEEGLRAGELVEEPRGGDRRAMGDAFEAPRRGLDVAVRDGRGTRGVVHYSSVMRPSKGTSSPSASIRSVIFAANASLPFSLPSAIAFCTAISISRWE